MLLNTEAKRAERLEQEWHGKDGTFVDVHPLNVATESHTEVSVIGGIKVFLLPFPGFLETCTNISKPFLLKTTEWAYK